MAPPILKGNFCAGRKKLCRLLTTGAAVCVNFAQSAENQKHDEYL
jgi:hypothetical protein